MYIYVCVYVYKKALKDNNKILTLVYINIYINIYICLYIYMFNIYTYIYIYIFGINTSYMALKNNNNILTFSPAASVLLT